MRKGRWIEKDDDEIYDDVFDYNDNINPLCKMCAERVDGSMTKVNTICMYNLVPEPALKKEEDATGTGYKCKKFNSIKDGWGSFEK